MKPNLLNGLDEILDDKFFENMMSSVEDEEKEFNKKKLVTNKIFDYFASQNKIVEFVKLIQNLNFIYDDVNINNQSKDKNLKEVFKLIKENKINYDHIIDILLSKDLQKEYSFYMRELNQYELNMIAKDDESSGYIFEYQNNILIISSLYGQGEYLNYVIEFSLNDWLLFRNLNYMVYLQNKMNKMPKHLEPTLTMFQISGNNTYNWLTTMKSLSDVAAVNDNALDMVLNTIAYFYKMQVQNDKQKNEHLEQLHFICKYVNNSFNVKEENFTNVIELLNNLFKHDNNYINEEKTNLTQQMIKYLIKDNNVKLSQEDLKKLSFKDLSQKFNSVLDKSNLWEARDGIYLSYDIHNIEELEKMVVYWKDKKEQLFNDLLKFQFEINNHNMKISLSNNVVSNININSFFEIEELI